MRTDINYMVRTVLIRSFLFTFQRQNSTRTGVKLRLIDAFDYV